MLAGADGQAGLDARDVGRGRQLAGQEFLKALKIAAYDLQNEVDFAIEHVHFAHFGQVVHRGFEGAQRFLGLALEADHREDGDGEAKLRSVELGVIAADDAAFLERAHPPQARRRGQAHALRQFDIGDASFVLQLGEQLTIDLIEICHAIGPCQAAPDFRPAHISAQASVCNP